MGANSIQPPAKNPCAYCPYREDVPSGVWSEEEYAKLPEYDKETGDQPYRLFQCHLYDRDDPRARVCAGWAGCHDMEENMALRIARATGRVTPEELEEIIDYESPVPLFPSGAEAAEHGIRDILSPGSEARAAIRKIERARDDLVQGWLQCCAECEERET